MYINRIEPRIDRIPEKRLSRKGGDSDFAATMESVIEMDVVEIGDATEDQKKQNKKFAGTDLPDAEHDETLAQSEEDEDDTTVDIEV